MRKSTVGAIALVFAGSFSPFVASAAEFYCEVMSLNGEAFVTTTESPRTAVKQGDLLKAGDILVVEKDAQLDLSFDKDWNNLTRIWGPSKIRIRSIYPTGLGMERGEIFAKLGKLPKGTTFEIQTPTAIAAVRGTQFMTSVSDQGQTSVVSYDHPVEVFNLDSNGQLGQHVMLEGSQKTVVSFMGEPPSVPVKAPEGEMQKGMGTSSDMATHVKDAVEAGHFAQIQTTGSVEAMMKLSEIYKETEKSKDESKPGSSDDRKTAGSNGPGGPGGSGSDLSADQVQQMKDHFVQLGGDPKDFGLAKDGMMSTGLNAANFDRINASTSQFIDHTNQWAPSAMEGSPRFDPGKMEGAVPFGGGPPPAIMKIENQINQTLNSTALTPPPAPPSCPNCAGSTVLSGPFKAPDGSFCNPPDRPC